MERKKKIQTKVKTKTTIDIRYKAIALGAIVFGAALFFFNFFNNDDAKAATTYISEEDGDWNGPSTWEGHKIPVSGNVAVIAAGTVVTISSKVNFNGKLHVYGTMKFDNGKMAMNGNSQLHLYSGGTLTSTKGDSDELIIGTGASLWKGKEITEIASPNVLCSTGQFCDSLLPRWMRSRNTISMVQCQ